MVAVQRTGAGNSALLTMYAREAKLAFTNVRGTRRAVLCWAAKARFYFETFNGRAWCPDDIGVEADSVDEAVKLAQSGLADLVRDSLPNGHALRLMVVVKDETGRFVGEAVLDMTAASRD